MKQELIHAVREYTAKGLSVIPTHNKVPVIKSWKVFQVRIPNEDDLLEWSGTFPSGLAVVTGDISGVCVVDIDNLEMLLVREWPETVRVETGRGVHLYFQYPVGKYIKSESGILPGIDMKAMGGLATLPPSQHVSTGKIYTWQTPFDRDRLAPLPQWLIDRCLSVPESVKVERDMLSKGEVKIYRRIGNPLSPDFVSRGMIDKALLVLIEDIANDVTHLRRGGYGRQIGLCPLHEEDTSSFTVYEQTNSFYCFGCSVGGDVIKLTQLIHKMTFTEAVRKLYKIYNNS